MTILCPEGFCHARHHDHAHMVYAQKVMSDMLQTPTSAGSASRCPPGRATSPAAAAATSSGSSAPARRRKFLLGPSFSPRHARRRSLRRPPPASADCTAAQNDSERTHLSPRDSQKLPRNTTALTSPRMPTKTHIYISHLLQPAAHDEGGCSLDVFMGSTWTICSLHGTVHAREIADIHDLLQPTGGHSGWGPQLTSECTQELTAEAARPGGTLCR